MADPDETESDEENYNVLFILFQESNTSPLKYLAVNVNSNTTILNLKNEVTLAWNIPEINQQLHTLNQDLNDDSKRFVDYQVSSNFITLTTNMYIYP